MQLRRPGLWLTALLLTALTVVLGGITQALSDPVARTAAVRTALQCVVELPLVVAFAMSDRLTRDRDLSLTDVLDTTPAGRLARLIGKYLGGVGAATVPLAVFYLGAGTAYAAGWRDPAALRWWLACFGTVVVPGILMIGAVAMCVALILPQALLRILMVGYWLWSGWLLPPRAVFGLGETVLSPSGGYPVRVLFGYRGIHGGASDWAGPVPGAPLNWLRPHPTAGTALLQPACLLGIAAVTLALTHLMRSRTTP